MIDGLMISHKHQPTAFIFSHPNHELASIGLITRLNPYRIIYITDGGGEKRCNETRDVLNSLGLADNVVFMNLSEDSFYEAIASSDCKYFESISRYIRTELSYEVPRYIFCDAVEFYNPTHDMTYPIVKSLNLSSTVFEIPLVYQDLTGNTVIQNPPESLKINSVCISLTEKEEELKSYLFKSKYHSLGEEMEYLISSDINLTKFEWVIKDRGFPIFPMHDQAIRYDVRGSELAAQNMCNVAITYKDHYVPLATMILENG